MSGLILLISAASTLLFALVVLIKLGVPILIAISLAMLVGYIWWKFESNEDKNEKENAADYLGALWDVKDIFKHVNKLF